MSSCSKTPVWKKNRVWEKWTLLMVFAFGVDCFCRDKKLRQILCGKSNTLDHYSYSPRPFSTFISALSCLNLPYLDPNALQPSVVAFFFSACYLSVFSLSSFLTFPPFCLL